MPGRLRSSYPIAVITKTDLAAAADFDRPAALRRNLRDWGVYPPPGKNHLLALSQER